MAVTNCFLWTSQCQCKAARKSDELFLSSLGLTQLVYVLQLSDKCNSSGSFILASAEIVDDVLVDGIKNDIADAVTKKQRKYKLGTIVYEPGCFLYYGKKICQSSNSTISIHANDKLEQLQRYPATRYRRKQCENLLNDIEMASYRSLCSSIGWIGSAASPICAFYASHLRSNSLHAKFTISSIAN